MSAQVDSPAPANAPADSRVRQLETCREAILDPNARPEDRLRWAGLLLSYRTSAATELFVELLSRDAQPDVQRDLCRTLHDRAKPDEERLNPAFVDPLVTLLGSDSAALRDLASQALADFPGRDIALRLGAIASRADATATTRLAAIEALAPNTHRREVVNQLVQLLGAKPPKIAERVVAILEPLVPQSFGSDVSKWRAWWSKKSRLSEDAWAADQVQILRDRLRTVESELRRLRSETADLENRITARSAAFQRDLYRTLNEEQRADKLKEWLADSLPNVKLTAMAIIKERMADEGQGPTGDVFSTILALLSDASPEVRREALEIARNLKDATVIQAILARLKDETDPPTRHAIFKALGKLGSPDSVEALVHEIAAADSYPECVREAALALGGVASGVSVADRFPEAVTTLNSRYGNVPPDDVPLRTALLTAMAGVGDPSFAPAFLGAVDDDDPQVLRAAIRGLRVLRDTSKMPRLRALTDHADPLVRLEAIETIGRPGGEEADLERIVPRLSPAVEPNAAVRETAWRLFSDFFSRRSIDERIKAADRLRDTPALEIRYLDDLVESLAAAGANGEGTVAVLDRLARVLVRESRFAEAAQHLRTLFDLKRKHKSKDAPDVGVRLFEAVLRSAGNAHVSDILAELAPNATDATKTSLVQAIDTYGGSLKPPLDCARLRRLLDELQAAPESLAGTAWDGALARLASLCPPPVEPDGALGENGQPQ